MKTYIIVDANNNVIAMSENSKIEIENCTTLLIDDVLDHDKIDGYVFKDNKVIFSDERFEEKKLESHKWDLRNKREDVCFSVINRGEIWYRKNVTTEERQNELDNWYQAWLDVTNTLVEPETPEWIK